MCTLLKTHCVWIHTHLFAQVMEWKAELLMRKLNIAVTRVTVTGLETRTRHWEWSMYMNLAPDFE